MKRKNPIALLGAWLALALTPAEPLRAADDRAAAGSSQHAGTVSGRISNQATQVYLEGARVTLQPLGVSTLTGRDGSYILTNIPPG